MILSMTTSTLGLNQYKEEITQYLSNFLDQEKKTLAKISLDDDIFYTLKDFVLRGKMARGNLLILAYQAFKGKITAISMSKWLLPLASALELIQAGLLIHDDIIDQDQQRRGQNSIWYYYALQNQEKNQHYGRSQAICLGDLCFFLANQLIKQSAINVAAFFSGNQNQSDKNISANLQNLINQEISQVIMAEMLDVQLAMNTKLPSLEQITETNLYKTARYSFSLPLMLAGYLTGQKTPIIKQVSDIGEKIGLIFQIQDDYLGIFGNEKITGKPVLSDLREGKKTIFYYFLMKNSKLSNQDQKLINQCFGSSAITAKQSLKIKQLFQSYSLEQVNKLINQLKTTSLNKIRDLKNQELQELLKQLLSLVKNRQQ